MIASESIEGFVLQHIYYAPWIHFYKYQARSRAQGCYFAMEVPYAVLLIVTSGLSVYLLAESMTEAEPVRMTSQAKPPE